MEKANLLKLIGIGAVLILVLNMILFALRIISGLVFWGVIIVGAVFAFKVLPKINKK
ncbi:MAG: hypothetical protein AABY40_01995 [Nanoarchaeota archaeon]